MTEGLFRGMSFVLPGQRQGLHTDLRGLINAKDFGE
jgi:hypothetical protein